MSALDLDEWYSSGWLSYGVVHGSSEYHQSMSSMSSSGVVGMGMFSGSGDRETRWIGGFGSVDIGLCFGWWWFVTLRTLVGRIVIISGVVSSS